MRLTAIRKFAALALFSTGFLVGPIFAVPSPQSKSDSGAQTVRVGGDVKPPAKTKDVKPVYPQYAIDHRIQGVVIIDATIGTDGKVKDTKVIRGLPFVSDAAVAAVKQWEFKPTVIDGKPVQVIMTIPVNFVVP